MFRDWGVYIPLVPLMFNIHQKHATLRIHTQQHPVLFETNLTPLQLLRNTNRSSIVTHVTYVQWEEAVALRPINGDISYIYKFGRLNAWKRGEIYKQELILPRPFLTIQYYFYCLGHIVFMQLCSCGRYRQLNSVLYSNNHILKSSEIIFNGLV